MLRAIIVRSGLPVPGGPAGTAPQHEPAHAMSGAADGGVDNAGGVDVRPTPPGRNLLPQPPLSAGVIDDDAHVIEQQGQLTAASPAGRPRAPSLAATCIVIVSSAQPTVAPLAGPTAAFANALQSSGGLQQGPLLGASFAGVHMEPTPLMSVGLFLIPVSDDVVIPGGVAVQVGAQPAPHMHVHRSASWQRRGVARGHPYRSLSRRHTGSSQRTTSTPGD